MKGAVPSAEGVGRPRPGRERGSPNQHVHSSQGTFAEFNASSKCRDVPAHEAFGHSDPERGLPPQTAPAARQHPGMGEARASRTSLLLSARGGPGRAWQWGPGPGGLLKPLPGESPRRLDRQLLLNPRRGRQNSFIPRRPTRPVKSRGGAEPVTITR
ncbi:uncharacterized protein LOC107503818 isoform X3 [Rousettus aegyptiacus]|uniref:uncharacterized protein LOC107503818 isoform X3 n=1 Tax=Rousettus aegyptiacus TaxID=9407 RepID=UPI00168D59D4|nr:uncharacterized protein LOC107503818 isoform X3 [Rousettus aegyptiacus]